MTDVIRNHIEIIQSPFGPKVVIAGHRVRVLDVAIWHERLGWSPAEIVDQIPTITLADVHAALAYYWDNRDEIERQIEADHAFADEMKKKHGSGLIAEMLRQRAG